MSAAVVRHAYVASSVSPSAPPCAQAIEENSVVPVPAAQQISDSMRVGDVSETSLEGEEDVLLKSENEEAMETGGNNSDPAGEDPNTDNQERAYPCSCVKVF